MSALNLGPLGLRVGGLAVALLAAACGGPTLADLQADEVELTVSSIASEPDVAAIGEPQDGLGVTRAYLSASEVTLLPCESDISQVDLGARGYELVQDPPASERVTTAVLELCGLRVDVARDAATAADGIPKNTTLYVEAQTADGTALTLASKSSLSLLFEAEAGSSFGAEPLLLGVDLSVWLAGLPLADDQADEQASLFESQLYDAAALYVDSNGNGALDDDEQTPVAHATAPR